VELNAPEARLQRLEEAVAALVIIVRSQIAEAVGLIGQGLRHAPQNQRVFDHLGQADVALQRAAASLQTLADDYLSPRALDEVRDDPELWGTEEH